MTSPTASPSRQPTPHISARPGRWWLRKLLSATLFLAVGLILIATLGLAQRMGWISAGGATTAAATAGAADTTYTCPMHPQIRQPQPGRCPICGMELVPAAAAAGDLDELAVWITPAQRRLANIQTAPVERAPLEATIQSVGAIAIDESRMATISSYIKGRIERLFADYTGVDVARGDHLAIVYSPELYSAQVEYIEARRTAREMSQSTLQVVRETQQKLAESARQRLVELGMTEEQIAELEQSGTAKSRLTIFSPMGGTVIEKMAVEGKYVSAGEPIYRIADLSTVWLMLELYPEDASRIRFGQRVEAEIQSLPGEVFTGRVAFIDPTVDVSRRTVGVRVEFLNNDRRLRPGDYASATIYLPVGQQGDVYDSELAGRWISPMHPQIIRDEPGECPICGMDLVPTTRYGYSDTPVDQPASLYVPRSAVLMAGSSSVVYVETDPGRFEIRPVTLGPILGDKVIVLGGLKEGEAVATAGNFLIDSQMQLAGKPSLIDPARAIAAANRPRNTPMQFEHVHVEPVASTTGEQIEELYDSYFEIQQTLAADQRPSEDSALRLHTLAERLAASDDIPEQARPLLTEIAEQSKHLHHLDIDRARHEAFRPISHAIVELATQLRGSGAEQPFTHIFCPMVKGGAGDWLQPGGKLAPEDLRNPYWGEKMLTCGDLVDVFPPESHGSPEGNPAHGESTDAPPSSGGSDQ
ncbi:efflux RND transporter periplasmic adaptor subunit [Maioricimonas sp. JC845]|uniref:efflux RND transporter periplasmic adaptor subunit n=1 Tax=Maioricimonas sp. JC845 TaxID=3232138 RepID=UPI0034574B93